jgi:hypothetical protein
VGPVCAFRREGHRRCSSHLPYVIFILSEAHSPEPETTVRCQGRAGSVQWEQEQGFIVSSEHCIRAVHILSVSPRGELSPVWLSLPISCQPHALNPCSKFFPFGILSNPKIISNFIGYIHMVSRCYCECREMLTLLDPKQAEAILKRGIQLVRPALDRPVLVSAYRRAAAR